MSIYKAKQVFADGLKSMDARQDPAMQDLLAGLYQLAEGLVIEISRLHGEIAHVSQQVVQIQKR